MKLYVKNFRCYTEKSWDFGDKGLTLLSGPSGSGKSTICMAIVFALYGTGTKLTTFGKTSCLVSLDIDNLKITRTKRPNRLLLFNNLENTEFEDDSAQSILNQKFGTSFDVTSYVQQNVLKSFVVMSPTDKLIFLEKFAFNGLDLGQIKGRCNAIIKKRSNDLLSITSQLEIATEYFSKIVKPEKVSFPLSKKGNKSIQNEHTRYKNTKILIKRAENKISELKEELSQTQIKKLRIEFLNNTIQKVEKNLKEIDTELSNILYEGDEKLIFYEQQLSIILSKKELLLLQTRFSEDEQRLKDMQTEEEENMKKEISSLKTKLWKEYSKDEIDTIISEYNITVSDLIKIDKLRKELESYKNLNYKDIENKQKTIQETKNNLEILKEQLTKTLIQEETYICPSCESSLRFQNNELILLDSITIINESSDSIRKKIQDLTLSLSQIEKNVNQDLYKIQKKNNIEKDLSSILCTYESDILTLTPSEAETNLEQLKEYKRSQKEIEKNIFVLQKNLQEKKYSIILEKFKKQLEQREKDIKQIEQKTKKTKIEIAINEEELRLTIQKQKQNKEKIDDLTRRKNVLLPDLNEEKLELKNLTKEPLKNVLELQNMISEKENELNLHKNNLILHENNLKKIEEYNNYCKQLSHYTEWEDKVNNLEREEKEARTKYSVATLLKDKILQAESLAIQNIINSINIHSQDYLDKFFPTEPILVRLQPFKTTKKTENKPQINMEIEYKGNQCDISSLSGGELSRVILAYTLSLSEIFNSPILLLDECTASLDQELTNTVMDGIRTYFSEKLVLVIAHQVVSGTFDRQIML